MVNRNLVSGVLIALVVLAGTMSVLGQRGNYTRVNIDTFISNLENTSDIFSRDFQSAGRPTANERRIVERFENAVDRLRRSFNSNNTWWNSRNDVQSIMDEARQVNVMMNNERFARSLEQQWRNLRRNINQLANAYELPDLDRGQGGFPIGGAPGGTFPRGGGNVPNWAVGTFYGRNPNSGGTITMTIQRNGNVTIDFGGGGYPTYASLNNRTLRVGTTVSTISRLNNGIRTTRRDNGEVIDYYTGGRGDPSPYPPVGDPGGYPPVAGGNVPTWARGTFYGRNPISGGTITLSIDNNGSVAISFDGSSPSYATLNGTTLYNQGVQSRVTRINNGIRTTRLDNGEVIDYYRDRR